MIDSQSLIIRKTLLKNRLFTNTLILLAIVLQAAWFTVLWVNYVHSPVLLRNADFRHFYTAGKISFDYGFSQVYNLDIETRVQEKVVGHILPQDELLIYNHPPLLLPVLNIIAAFEYETAYILNCILLLLISVACLPFLLATLKSICWPNSVIRITFLGFMLFEPLFISILKGQDTVLLLLGLAIWLNGWIQDDDRQAGLGLALTTIRPQISLFLAIPFLFRKQRVFAWYCLGAGLLVVYSYLLVGKQGFLDFLTLLKLSSAGQDFGLNQSAMYNFMGLLLRIFPGVDALALNGLKWGLYGLSLVGMVLIWRQSSKIHIRHIVLLVITGLFFSPHLHYHDLAALLVPILAMLLIWVNKGVIQDKMSPMIIFTLSIIMLSGNIITPLYHLLPYLIMILLLVGSWAPDRFILRARGSSMQTD